MEIDWILVIYSIGLLGAVLSLAKVFSIWESRANDQGLEMYSEKTTKTGAIRNVFGRRTIEIEARADDFTHSVEICDTRKQSYTRIMIDFPDRVKQGITLMTEADQGVIKRFLHLQETKIGHEAFDSQFLILAPSQERAESLITNKFRRQVVDLKSRFDEVKVSQEGVFLYTTKPLAGDELTDALEGALNLAREYFRRVTELEAEEKAQADSMLDQAPSVDTAF